MQADSDPGDGAAAAQPAEQAAVDVSASRTDATGGALASGGGGPGPEGTVAAVSGGGPVSREGDTTGAGRMHTHMGEVPEAEPHMNTHMDEMTEIEQPDRKRKHQRVRSSQGRSCDARRRNDD
eukprot:2366376-Prymnesium_polylepis.1